MARRNYHHGDLKAVILVQAVALASNAAPTASRWWNWARAAGVSHAAPAHHFTDLAGIVHRPRDGGLHPAGGGPPRNQTWNLPTRRLTCSSPSSTPATTPSCSTRCSTTRSTRPCAAEVEAAAELTGGARPWPIPMPRATDGSALAAWSLVHGFALLDPQRRRHRRRSRRHRRKASPASSSPALAPASRAQFRRATVSVRQHASSARQKGLTHNCRAPVSVRQHAAICVRKRVAHGCRVGSICTTCGRRQGRANAAAARGCALWVRENGQCSGGTNVTATDGTPDVVTLLTWQAN